jgi:hypothetical protein
MPAVGPSLQGFTSWVYGTMGVPSSVMPTTSVYLQLAYDWATDVVLSSSISGGGLDMVPSYSSDTPVPPPGTGLRNSPTVYAIAVYNCAGDILVRVAQDDPTAMPPPENATTYWADLRNALGVNTFNYGWVTSAGDQGTSTGIEVLDQLKGMTLANLMQTATPWGRTYLAIAGQWGPNVWGIS